MEVNLQDALKSVNIGTEQEFAACRTLVATLQQRIEDHEDSLGLLTEKLSTQLEQ